MADYKVKFEVFEGPLDLLLYLIKKEEVDIYDVNLTQLATQFIEYIEVMRLLDLEIAGEFLVMASTLMFIKSRELLPLDQQVETEGEEEGEDPRWELIRQLVEYKKFKDAAAQLQTLEARQEEIFPRQPAKPDFEAEASPHAEASLFDLLSAVSAILKRVGQQEAATRDVFEDKWTVSEKIDHIVKMLGDRPVVKFSELFAGASGRVEVIATFLAMLELIRLKQLVAEQSEVFGEIALRRPPPTPPASESPTAAPAEAVVSESPETPSSPKPIASSNLPAKIESPEPSEPFGADASEPPPVAPTPESKSTMPADSADGPAQSPVAAVSPERAASFEPAERPESSDSPVSGSSQTPPAPESPEPVEPNDSLEPPDAAETAVTS